MSDKPDPAGHQRRDPLGGGWSLKTPLYETSTFVFETAEACKRYFEVTYQGADLAPGEVLPFAYSRLDSPNLRPVEAELASWEETDDALVFNSGMGAISTVFLSLLRPGDLVLHSTPVYGLTVTVLRKILGPFGVEAAAFGPEADASDLESMVDGRRLAMVYVETPSNPTIDIFDLDMASGVASTHGALMVVDNTFLSPVLQKPVRHGADLVVHSATKYLGGHHDLTAGVVCGPQQLIDRLRHERYRLGTTAQPGTAWMLGRSLETLRVRVEAQVETATSLAAFLDEHPKVVSVSHLSLIGPDDPRHDVYKRQCSGPGAMISFEVAGGEEEAFKVMNAMKLASLAVSLGGTESLVMHPWSTSHALMPAEENLRSGVTSGLIRFSVGLEPVDELIADLKQALAAI